MSPPLDDTGTAAPRDHDVAVPPKLSDEPRSFRPGGGPVLRPAADPSPLTADGLLGGVLVVSSAVLPAIDESDPPQIAAPPPRGDGTEPTDDRRPPDGGDSQGNAFLLGLSSSAALGVGLYAPDLAAAVRRSFPRRVPIPRTRPASSRDARASE
jgi:hypothetical protein